MCASACEPITFFSILRNATKRERKTHTALSIFHKSIAICLGSHVWLRYARAATAAAHTRMVVGGGFAGALYFYFKAHEM